jgi:hypothetical protein
VILNRTPEALIGRVMSPWELAPLGVAGLPAPPQPGPGPGEAGPCAAIEAERWLRGVGGERRPGGRGVVELAAWAEGYLGLNAASA